MLIDCHCHANLYLVIDEILKEAKSVGISKIIAVGMSLISLKRILEISKKYEEIYPALGIHPEEALNNKDIDAKLDEAIDLIRNNHQNICAIGEIGLDHYFIKDESIYPLQMKIFKHMLGIAQELELPVNLHTKGAEKLIFEILPSYNIPNINIHWYSGPEKYLKLGIERGYYFSITPAINYSPAVKNVATVVDEEHLLLESDGPVKYSGIVGTPAMIKMVLNKVSKLKKMDIETLEMQIERNTMSIFPKIFN